MRKTIKYKNPPHTFPLLSLSSKAGFFFLNLRLHGLPPTFLFLCHWVKQNECQDFVLRGCGFFHFFHFFPFDTTFPNTLMAPILQIRMNVLNFITLSSSIEIIALLPLAKLSMWKMAAESKLKFRKVATRTMKLYHFVTFHFFFCHAITFCKSLSFEKLQIGKRKGRGLKGTHTHTPALLRYYLVSCTQWQDKWEKPYDNQKFWKSI